MLSLQVLLTSLLQGNKCINKCADLQCLKDTFRGLCNTSEWEVPLYRHTFKLKKLQKSKSVKNHHPQKLQIIVGKLCASSRSTGTVLEAKEEGRTPTVHHAGAKGLKRCTVREKAFPTTKIFAELLEEWRVPELALLLAAPVVC